MTDQAKVRGPASYFPSIEQRYGKPVTHWLGLLAGLGERKHAEQVAWRGRARHGTWPRQRAGGLPSRERALIAALPPRR